MIEKKNHKKLLNLKALEMTPLPHPTSTTKINQIIMQYNVYTIFFFIPESFNANIS